MPTKTTKPRTPRAPSPTRARREAVAAASRDAAVEISRALTMVSTRRDTAWQRRGMSNPLAGAGIGGGVGGSRAATAYRGSYDATTSSRLRTRPTPVGGGADDHLDPWTLDQLRRIGQDLMRNSPTAQGMVSRIARFIAGGVGFKLSPKTGDPEYNAQILAWWNAKSARKGFDARGRFTLRQLVPLWTRRMLVDGDVLLVKQSDMSVQTVRGERVCSAWGEKASGGNSLVNGVECDPAGRILRFCVRSQRPPRVYVGASKSGEFSWVDARDAFWLTSPVNASDDSTRGEPITARLVHKFDDLDEVTDSTVLALKMATYLALVFTSPDPAQFSSALIGSTVTADGGDGSQTQKEQVFGPGSTMVAPTGHGVTQVKPEHPSGTYEMMVRTMLRQIANELGIPYELATFDFSQSNFYGNRAAMAVAWPTFIEPVQDWIIDDVLTGLYLWQVQAAIEDGELPRREGWEEHEWVRPLMPVLSELEEAKSKSMMIAAGLKTREKALKELDEDYDHWLARTTVERENERPLGFWPPVNAGATNAGPDGNADPAEQLTTTDTTNG